MSSRKLLVKTIALMTVVGMVGCAGTGDSVSTPNAFVGIWQGPWDSNGLQQTGRLDFTVYFDGSVVGTMTIEQLSLSGSVVGRINKAGQLEAIAGFGAIGNYFLKGGVAITGDNTLASSGNIRFQNKDYGFDFDLPQKAGGSEE